MNIAIIDAEIVGKTKHRFPNLCSMKLSSYHKSIGDSVILKTDYKGLELFDKVYISKVFTKTKKQTQGLSDVIVYAVDIEKTGKIDDENTEIFSSFVSGVNCHPSTARDEMLAVKRRFGTSRMSLY